MTNAMIKHMNDTPRGGRAASGEAVAVRVNSARRRAVRRMLLLLMILFGLLARGPLPVSAEGRGYSWYCVHAKDHVQPRADACFDFIRRYGGYYLDTRPGHTRPDDEDKVVYLTFDAGYENGNVTRVLDALKAEGVTGAFFILGGLVRSEPALVRRMADEGHLVCNHSFAHKNMTGWSEQAFREELGRLETACREETGVAMAPYFRPPEGRFDEDMLKFAQNAGYKTIFWSFGYADWDNGKQPDPAAAKEKILSNVHNGAVILLHPTSATNAAILGDVIRELKAQGYRFGSLDELTGAEEETETGLPCPADSLPDTAAAPDTSAAQDAPESAPALPRPGCHGRRRGRPAPGEVRER